MDPRAAESLRQVHTAAGDGLALTLDGGQLLSWHAGGRERLFVSPHATWRSGQAIRGGVPVIFPQFGSFGPGAKHGFARLQRWQPVAADVPGALAAELFDTETTRALWPHRFRLRVQAQATPQALAITLSVHNRDADPFEFAAALHTYLAVADLGACALHGLQGRPYLDCVGGGRVERRHGADPLRFDGEVDRVYPGTGELRLVAADGDMTIAADGFTDTVVWNPGTRLAAAMSDLGADLQPRFVCVEAAIVGSLRLEPGQSWQGTQHFAVTGPR